MKKPVLFLALALATATQALAQSGMSSKDYDNGSTGTESRNTGFGIKGGYNTSNINGSGADLFPNKNSFAAFNAGVYGQFGFSNFASLQVEALYIRKGYHTDAGTTSTGTSYSAHDTRLDYFELPVLFVGNITETLSVHVGPQISVLTKVLNDGKNLDLNANGYNTLDYGVIGGAEARLGPARLGVRYDLSLADIYKTGAAVQYGNTALTVTDGKVRNQSIQVYLGIGFRR
ncbi:hypothetical protein GCM10022409_48920 [Hymenobacter glaciei]|uniref:Outer membrane protein beta-barrel domain-containing protein n=1 Tax=Hymenobacter glaciei TaxID=877209 RepID=A0ABP7UYW8_9BACT